MTWNLLIVDWRGAEIAKPPRNGLIIGAHHGVACDECFVHLLGIPVEGPAYIYGDNQLVLANTTIPDSTLKKKSQSITYHFVCEGSAHDEWRTHTSAPAWILLSLIPGSAVPASALPLLNQVPPAA